MPAVSARVGAYFLVSSCQGTRPIDRPFQVKYLQMPKRRRRSRRRWRRRSEFQVRQDKCPELSQPTWGADLMPCTWGSVRNFMRPIPGFYWPERRQ